MPLNPKVVALIANGKSLRRIAGARVHARALVPGFPKDGCAAFLGSLMRLSGIDVPRLVGAEELADAIHARGWQRVECPGGVPRPGDIGVTVDLNGNRRADHIFLILAVSPDSPDFLTIADNQKARPHQRSLRGRDGRTPTDYLLRAPEV